MKILFVSPYLPGPPVFGGQRRIHGLMTALAKHHEISLISLIDPSKDHSVSLADARRFCHEVITVPDRLHRVSGRMKRVLQLRSLLSRQSWEQKLHRRPAFQHALDRHLEQQRYDIVNCEFVFMSGYHFDKRTLGDARLVLDEHNVEYDILARTTAKASRFDRKLYNSVNHLKLKREEVRAWKRFDGITFTSDRDRKIAQQEAPSAHMAVIPNGVDVDSFRPRTGDQLDPNVILFFGAINYFPNSDAVDFFLKEVFPLLSAKHPRLRVRIVGPGVPDEIKALANDRVEVVGFVDDLRAEIARAGVVVAPLRIGGGTRLKILEAMALAKPIVSTRLGAEGIDVQHEREILLADSPQDFAREIERIVADATLGARLGDAARRTAERHYSWLAIAARMTNFYATLAATRADDGREALGA